ncbi:MAG: DUF1295 domain-containing protein [Candidatus Obscuribacter sp.]|nr:DUF1295 domain-containing protein [Candidatus Obscuribacter sp.]
MSFSVTPALLNLWGYGFVLATGLFFTVWLVAERTKNGGIVDVFWGVGFALVAALYFGVDVFVWQNPVSINKLLLLGMVFAWSLRLTFFLLMRFLRVYPEEDGRYLAFRKAWGDKASQGMFLAFQLQAVLLASLCWPFAVVMSNDQINYPGNWQFLAICIFVLALAGEGLADSQLESFKKDPANRGKVCQSGLWQYSRHPNYFFEWLVWVAFLFFVCNYPAGLYSFYCPAMMYFFLTRVTGIKATEEQALRTKGDAYKKYQESTSAFFPWFKSKSKE